MTFRVSTFISLLALLLPLVTASHWSRRHQEVALRARGDVEIHKRQSFTNSRLTYYDVGLGACGVTNVPSDWIVALNFEQYGSGYPGPQCFKSITIQYGGKTATAVIMDECMGCPYGGLDFSDGLFSYFADLSVGVIYGTWWFNDNNGGSGGQTTSAWTPTTTWEPPATTSTPDYTPPPTTSSTPDYTPPPSTSSTSTYTPPPSTSSTPTYTPLPTTTPSTSSTSSILSTGLTNGLAIQTGGRVSTPGTSNPENILVINDIVVELGIMLSAVEKSA